MRITSYSFGRITVDDRTYTSDIIIFPDHVKSSWWRLEGHLLQIPDLKEVIDARPDVLIIGTGYYGTMRVPDEVIQHLRSLGMDVHVHDSKKAVELFNKISSERDVVAALHLTC
jgi:hypothetical protein